MTTWAVQAEGLTKRYGQVRALDGLDLEIAPGTVTGVLGPNGAGKTTTVRVLATLLRPDAGSARVAGHDVLRDPDAVRRTIGLAGQYAAVDENLTGEENLRLLARLHLLSPADARARAAGLLEQFDLVEAGRRITRTYSGGMRRRLDLAAALVNRPQVLFLDEPTTGLDPRSRRQLWDVLRDLVRDGTTLLLTPSTSTRRPARPTTSSSSTAVACRHGERPGSSRRLGATRLTLGLSSSEARPLGRLVLDEVGVDVRVGRAQVVLHVADGARALADSAARLHRRGSWPQTAEVTEPSLDEVFCADRDGGGVTIRGRPGGRAPGSAADRRWRP
jgi:ABC-type Na+ transport system ATPase subunit NatA